MAHLFGVSSARFLGTETVNANPSGFLYRRSENYFTGFTARVLFTKYFNPSAPTGGAGIEFSDSETETEDGTVNLVHVSRVTSEGNGFNALWGSKIEPIATNDSRVTFSLSTTVSEADILAEVPTERVQTTAFIITTDAGGSWAFLPPIPLEFAFTFEGGTYTAGARIPWNAGVLPHSYAGRFVHGLPDYAGGGTGMCAVDGTIFTTYAEEQAHNSLAFQMGEGDESTTFNETWSEVSFGSEVTSGELDFVSNSEVAGGDTGRVFFPAIVRLEATFTEAGRLHIDGSATIAPTAEVIGFLIEGGARGTAQDDISPAIDHFEVDGTSYPGPYVPGSVFDIVFEDDGATHSGYLTISAVVDADLFPANTDTVASGLYKPLDTATNVQLNGHMSVPALLGLTVQPSGGMEGMIVRPSGQIKTRAGSQLWQHRGEARYFAGELASGDVYARDEEEGEWNLMANAWTGVSGARPLGFTSLPFKGAISIAKVGDDVKSRYAPDGINWQAPVTVCDYEAGKWSIASHEASGSDAVSVMNLTTNAHHKTTNRGKTWQEVTG